MHVNIEHFHPERSKQTHRATDLSRMFLLVRERHCDLVRSRAYTHQGNRNPTHVAESVTVALEGEPSSFHPVGKTATESSIIDCRARRMANVAVAVGLSIDISQAQQPRKDLGALRSENR
jgi:hypothetical protein